MEEQRAEGEYESGAGILHVFGRQLKLCRERAGLDRTELGGADGVLGVDDRLLRTGKADSATQVHRPGR